LAIFLSATCLAQAQISDQEYRMEYDNGLLTLSAKQASLKGLLRNLAETLNIYITYPRDLNKKITIKLYDVTPIKALRRLLKSQNYALIYSASRSEEATAISELHVLPKPVGRGATRKFRSQKSRGQRTLARIKSYERKLEMLKDRLAKTNSDSRAGRSIRKQIRSTAKTIARLQKKLER
jgi:hypothetical protein